MARITVRNIQNGLTAVEAVGSPSLPVHGRGSTRDSENRLLAVDRPANLAAVIRGRIKPLGGITLEETFREVSREAPDFA